MYLCVHVCVHVCAVLCVHVCMQLCVHGCAAVCAHVCLYNCRSQRPEIECLPPELFALLPDSPETGSSLGGGGGVVWLVNCICSCCSCYCFGVVLRQDFSV